MSDWEKTGEGSWASYRQKPKQKGPSEWVGGLLVIFILIVLARCAQGG